MDKQKYAQVMQTITGRKDHIECVMAGAKSTGKVSKFTIESICLQLRMMIEDIAVACVIANAEEMPDLARGLKGEYRPNLVLKGLEKINPKCYPIPKLVNTQESYGKFRDAYNRPEGDWLTRDEAVEEYGRLSSFVHSNLKTYNGNSVDYPELYKKCECLKDKIWNLLSHHHITVLDEKIIYQVLMSGEGMDENRLEITEYLRIPKNMEQAAIRGEVNVEDIMEAWDDQNTGAG